MSKHEAQITRFANVQRSNLQSTLVEAVLDAQAYHGYREHSNWPDEEGLYVKESPGVGICVVVLKDSIWFENVQRLILEIQENPNL